MKPCPHVQGAAIGDVFLGTAVINHDRRIPLPNFDKYGIGYSLCLPTPHLQVRGRYGTCHRQGMGRA